MKYIITACGLSLLLISNLCIGQYMDPGHEEISLEKSFEHTIYYFKPNYLNSYGIGGMGNVTPGLINTPLLNIYINPAFIVTNSIGNHYLYLDFRGNHNRKIETERSGSSSYSSYFPPIYALNGSEELKINRHEPLFAVSYLIRPFGQKFGRFSLGLTYQMLFTKDSYSPPAENTYQSVLGYDFVGIHILNTGYRLDESGPNSNNRIRDKAHFINFLSGLGITSQLKFAIRFSYVFFNRDGNYFLKQDASKDLEKTRKHHYDHWDFSVGFNYRFSNKVIAGITGGYLQGWVKQNFDGLDFENYELGTINQGPEWNYYYKLDLDKKSWDHDGHTRYGGVNLIMQWSPKHKLFILYRHLREHVNISFSSTSHDTSYVNSYFETPSQMRGSEVNSAYKEIRSGTGSQCDFSHRLAVMLRWNVFRKTQVSFGFKLDAYMRKIITTEEISIDKFLDYKQFDNYSDERYYQFLIEKSQLEWDFKMNVMSIQLPMFINYPLSNVLKLQLGFNARLVGWWYDKDYIHSKVINREEQPSPDPYPIPDPYPDEYFHSPYDGTRSDFTTTALLGLTVSPSTRYDIHFMIMPHYVKTTGGIKMKEFQWWIDMSLHQ